MSGRGRGAFEGRKARPDSHGGSVGIRSKKLDVSPRDSGWKRMSCSSLAMRDWCGCMPSVGTKGGEARRRFRGESVEMVARASSRLRSAAVAGDACDVFCRLRYGGGIDRTSAMRRTGRKAERYRARCADRDRLCCTRSTCSASDRVASDIASMYLAWG